MSKTEKIARRFLRRKTAESDFFWLVLPFDEQTASKLSSGRLDGLKGISGTKNILFHFGGSKAALRMNRGKVKNKNDLYSVSDTSVHTFLKDEMALTRRLFDIEKPLFGATLGRFVSKYLGDKLVGAKDGIGGKFSKLLKNHHQDITGTSFERWLSQNYQSKDDAPTAHDQRRATSEILEIVKRSFIKYLQQEKGKEIYIDKRNKSEFREGDEIYIDTNNLMPTSTGGKAIKEAVKDLRRTYAEGEDEWIVEDDVFDVPEGSDLFIHSPEMSDFLTGKLQDLQNGEITEDDIQIRKRDILRRRDIERWIEQYDLDSKYDIELVSSRDDI